MPADTQSDVGLYVSNRKAATTFLTGLLSTDYWRRERSLDGLLNIYEDWYVPDYLHRGSSQCIALKLDCSPPEHLLLLVPRREVRDKSRRPKWRNAYPGLFVYVRASEYLNVVADTNKWDG